MSHTEIVQPWCVQKHAKAKVVSASEPDNPGGPADPGGPAGPGGPGMPTEESPATR